jgi:hypothetical protein
MITPNLFTVERLLAALLDDRPNGRDQWRKHLTIEPKYVPERAPKTLPIVAVRFENWFLRYSKGPAQGFFWDIYGDDFQTTELAFMAVLQAPIPPTLIRRPLMEEQDNG